METGLGLGSNLGDRQATLVEARRRILSWPDVRLAAQSPLYETEPVGVRPEHQDKKFLNTVLVLESPLDGHAWYARLRDLETELGRERSLDRYAPRTLDIDILFVGDTRVESGGLKIPHPHWAERRFVVQPLADIRPDLVVPGQTRTVRQVLADLPPAPAVALAAKTW